MTDSEERSNFSPSESPSTRVKDTTSCSFYANIFVILAGNIVEWYDFVVIGLLAEHFEANFFPHDTDGKVLKGLFIFGIAFIFRPLGALLFGYIADKYGRILSLKLSIALMAFCTLGIGCLPTYNIWGSFATISLFALRILQGISVGGEGMVAVVTMYEKVNPNERIWFITVVGIFSAIGMQLAQAVVYILTASLSSENMTAFGWRIPFFLSFLLILSCYAFRQHLTETEEFLAVREQALEGNPIREALYYHSGTIVILTIIKAVSPYYVFSVWIPDYLKVRKDGVQISEGSLIILVISVFAFISALAYASLAHLFEDSRHQAVMLVSKAFTLFVCVPIVFSHLHELTSWYFALPICIPLAIATVIHDILLEWFAFSLAPEITSRTVVLGLSHNLSAVLCGNLPFVAQNIVKSTGSTMNVGWMLLSLGSFAYAILFLAVWFQDKLVCREPVVRECVLSEPREIFEEGDEKRI